MKEERISELKQMAKELLIKDKYHNPLIIMENRTGKMELFGATFKDDTDKDIFAMMINKMLESGKYKSYLFISESWVVKQNKDKALPLCRPSQHKDRRECLILNYRDDMGNGKMIIITFNRIDDKIVFDAEEENVDVPSDGTYEGRFSFWK
jgi:hypothetical protein